MDNFDRKVELVNGLETDFLRILYYDFNNKYKNDYKSYEHSRLCTIIEGEKKVKINNKESFTYGNKDFIVLPPNSTVNFEINVPTKALVFEIYDSLIENITEKVNIEFETRLNTDVKENILFQKITPLINNSINKILRTALSCDKNKEFLIDLYAQEMTYNLIKIRSVHDMLNSNSNNFVQRSIKMMNENLSKNLAISDIAEALNMSNANFSTKF